MTALQLAFESRVLVRSVRSDPNFSSVMALLRSSSKDELVSTCPATGASLLFYAVQRHNDEEAEEVCRYLCDEASACDPTKADRNSQTALFFAARDGNARCLKYLMSKGCNPNDHDTALQTALFYAARDGRTECVKVLLEGGAAVNAVDHLGQTALFYAARDGRVDTVALMLEKGATTNLKDRQRRTALYYAQKNNQKGIVSLLKASSGSDGGGSTPGRQATSVEGSDPGGTLDGLRESRSAKRPRPSDAPDAAPTAAPATTRTSNDLLGAPSVKRRCYRLVIVDCPSSFEYISAPNDEISFFESLAPSIAVWPKSSPSPVTDIFHDLRAHWIPIVSAILNELGTIEGGWIFSKPVDCKAWGCPDYYEVIKHPVDYSTIRTKMKNQEYLKCAEFMADMDLIFSNCFLYNKPDSPVSAIGHNVQKLFRDLVQSKLQRLLDQEKEVEAWYSTRKNDERKIVQKHAILELNEENKVVF